ncbi:MAG TPA: acetate--CoA ligase family protein [Actinomycetes bacterium]|nr:acetate--CoA ligase family protein [Actinomycetes bacterium]
MTDIRPGALARLFTPRSVAVVGASPNPRRIGSRVLANLRRHQFTGQVYVVNPQHEQVEDVPAYASLRGLPEAPDLALLSVDADTSLEVLAELGELGGRNAVLLASGFEAGSDGERRLARLRELAERYGLNIVGPNSQGLWSVGHRMVLAFGSEAMRARVDAGPVAVLAQSGSLGGAVTRRLLDLGVGVSYFVSTGDGAVLDTADYLGHVIDDPNVRVLALYLEGARDGRRLGTALREASRRGIRAVALPGGVSTAGRATTTSHTGRIIRRPRLLTDLLRQHGVVVTRTMREFVAATLVLALAPEAMRRTPRTAVLGISGGMLALLVDACERRVDLAEFSNGTLARLRETLPSYTSPQNPVDVTGAVVEEEALLVDTIDAVLADPRVDALIAGLDNRGYDRVVRNADRFRSSAERARKPVVFSLWDPPADRAADIERRLGAAGVFVVDDPSDAVSPLEWLTGRAPAKGATQPAPLRVFDITADLRTWPGIERLAHGLGARVPATWLLGADDPIPAAELVSPPYVVKPLPSAVAHKTDRGLVHLHLYLVDDVTKAVARVREAVGPSIPVLVQQMVTGAELLATVGDDPDWGPVLTLGAGGRLVELLNEVTHLAVPSGEPEIREALARLRMHSILQGFRHTPPADLAALVRAVSRLQRIVLTHRDTIEEIELNPIVVGPAGQGVFVVDVLVKDRRK